MSKTGCWLELRRIAGDRRRGEERARKATREARALVPLARDAGLTVAEIAEALEMSRPSVYDLMNHERKDGAR